MTNHEWITTSGSAGILVTPREAGASGGCGSAGEFGAGALLVLPMLLAAVLRRRQARGARRTEPHRLR